MKDTFKKYFGKAKEGTQKAYQSTKAAVEKKIHDKKKDIAIEVLEDTRASDKLDGRKKDSQILNEATNIVEATYKKGAQVPSARARERKYTSEESHEQAYKKSRVSKVVTYKRHSSIALKKEESVSSYLDIFAFLFDGL